MYIFSDTKDNYILHIRYISPTHTSYISCMQHIYILHAGYIYPTTPMHLPLTQQ